MGIELKTELMRITLPQYKQNGFSYTSHASAPFANAYVTVLITSQPQVHHV